MFIPEKRFNKDCKVFTHPAVYKNVIDLFIFKNQNVNFGFGKYSMYVVSTNGIVLYEGIDKRDIANIKSDRILANDPTNIELSFRAIDCNPQGQIVFDIKNQSN